MSRPVTKPLPNTFPAKGYLRGIILSLITALLWGVLPIFLKITLQGFHTGTIAWFRFFLHF